MNLHELVWSKEIPLREKLNQLGALKNQLTFQITNTKPLKLDIYHKFSKSLENETKNNQYKEVILAIWVCKIIKRWDNNYQIDLDKRESPDFFLKFFRWSFDNSNHSLNSLGINLYKKQYTFKTFIIWADKLVRDQVITEAKYNVFMKYLEKSCAKN